jgi:putative ABC transport system substrate-binding protein
MRRRAFIAALGGAAAWPMVARGQQPTMPVIGFLHQASPGAYPNAIAAFGQGLNQTGYIEGHNVAIELRWAEGQYDRLPGMAADLVNSHVDAIVAAYLPAALAAKRATITIPMVFISGTDPVKSKLVDSLNRPGGNITGITVLTSSLVSKRLELLRELIPTVTVIGALINPSNPNAEIQIGEVQAAASALGQNILILKASTKDEIDGAFATLVQQHIGALLIGADSFFTSQQTQIVALAARHAMPTVHARRDSAAIGGLMSYGPVFADEYRQAGIYAGRILKGEKPGELPVQQSTKVELVINLKTAKALGLTIPLPLLGRADEVIE